MPLSEHEQRILADIEARLREDDPRFADVVATTTVAARLRNRLRWSVAAFFVGFVLLFVGLAVHLLWGLLGFGVMLGAVYQGVTAARRLAAMDAEAGGSPRSALQRYLDGARRRSDDDA